MTALDEALSSVLLMDEFASAARAELAALREHLATDEKLLEERNHLLAAIPACPTHGAMCVPHALDWVESAKASRTTGAGLAMLAVREQEERLLAVEQAVAALQKPRTCATCRFLGGGAMRFFCQTATPVGRIPDPANFGCIHHVPLPPAADDEKRVGLRPVADSMQRLYKQTGLALG